MVLLSQVLSHQINIGYEHLNNMHVLGVNGTKVRNLAHLVELVEASSSKFLTFDLAPNDEMVVLEAAALAAATGEILAQHNISSARSGVKSIPSFLTC